MPEQAQFSLFDVPPQPEPEKKTEAALDLTPRTRLSRAMEAYRDHMIARRFAENTVKAFMYDLDLVAEFFTPARPIGEIAHRDLEKFIDWLVTGRGVPCNPKSLARRITTLKAFFGWLAGAGGRPGRPGA